jgi:twitching motility protein PilT
MNYEQELTDLLSTVVREGGSDLHLSEGRYPTIRVNGLLIPLVRKAVLSHVDIDSLLNLMIDDASRKRFADTKELDFSYQFNPEARFRGNAYIQRGCHSIALRLIQNKIKSLKELGLPEILESFTRMKQGFFLVVGPVGQGKSTTLASMVELINQERAEHIITIEDPIEY